MSEIQKDMKRKRKKFDIEFPSSQAYIYVMYVPKSSKKKCYVGQSAAANFSRLKTHFDNAYNDDDKDKSIELIREWPLKFIDFNCYYGNQSSSFYFGLPREAFIRFFSIFRPVGGQRISKDTSQVAANIRQKESGLVLNLNYNDTDSYEWKPTVSDMMNAAEILWSCKMKMLGYEMLNADMGGQQTGWEYQDINGQWIKITANKTSIDQIIKIMISANLSVRERQLLSSIKSKIDPLLKKALTGNLAKLLASSINNTIINTKNVMSKTAEVDLRKTVLNNITRIFNGTAKRSNKFDSSLYQIFPTLIGDLNKVLTNEEKELLGYIDITEKLTIDKPIITNLLTAIINDIAGKLTTSALKLLNTMSKNTKVTISFYVQDDEILVRGSNGINEKNSLKQSFTVSMEQLVNIPILTDLNEDASVLLGGGITEPDYLLSDEIKWNWTVNRFNTILARTKDEKKGLLALARNDDTAKDFSLVGENYAVLPKKSEQEKLDTLSMRMNKEYGKHLSSMNLIMSHWRTFFSNLYSGGDGRWDTTTIEEGDIAFLKEDVLIKQISVDPVKIGFFIDDTATFFTSGSSSLKKAYVIF